MTKKFSILRGNLSLQSRQKSENLTQKMLQKMPQSETPHILDLSQLEILDKIPEGNVHITNFYSTEDADAQQNDDPLTMPNRP